MCALEQAAKDAGHDMDVPFSPGRTDASQWQTDVDAFAVLEPTADGFRSHFRAGDKRRLEELLLERASLLGLTAPEMLELPAPGHRRGLRVRRRAAEFVPDFVAAWNKVMNLDRFTPGVIDARTACDTDRGAAAPS